MGTIVYGAERRIHVDDRTLAHIKSVVVTKLRRQESFTLSCLQVQGEPGSRISLWIHPSIPLQFEFDTADRHELNREWLTNLMVSANASGDLRIEDEPIAAVA